MATSTRDGALGDLVADGALNRLKPGVYEVLKPAPDGVTLPTIDEGEEVDQIGSYVMSALTVTFGGATMTIFDLERAFAEPGWPFDRAAVEASLAEQVGHGNAEWVPEDEGWRATAKFRDELVGQVRIG
jgi:hypothetical protein